GGWSPRRARRERSRIRDGLCRVGVGSRCRDRGRARCAPPTGARVPGASGARPARAGAGGRRGAHRACAARAMRIAVVAPSLDIVVPSEYLRTVFVRYGYPARAVPNLVDTTRFSYRDRMPPHARILSARNLDPYYRVDVTLEAFALLRERFPGATLTIAGDGSERARLMRRASVLGDRGIRFLGRVAPADMPALYEAADIFVNSSIVDNQPLSVLEAFAAGLPVISTATGDIAALVRDGETGLVVPPDDPASTAKAVTVMLEYPVRALRMARQARSEVGAC